MILRPQYRVPIQDNAMTYTEKSNSRNARGQSSAQSTCERSRKRAKILLDDDSDDEASGSGGISVEEGGNSSGDHILAVNQEYAQKFEHNKKREELQRRVYNVPYIVHKVLG